MIIKQPVLRTLSVALLLLGACADVPSDPMSDENPQAVADDTPELESTEQDLRVAPPARPVCGGFLGTACPGIGFCVDDPRDDCDPRGGGADCTGLCTCKQTEACPTGSFFDTRPTVCTCRKTTPLCPRNPCATTTCSTGSTCQLDARCQASCVPKNGCPVCPPGRVCPAFCPGPVLTF
ncbi:MAG: hypothetical protein ABW252_17365 [Polyangiales bacterium]